MLTAVIILRFAVTIADVIENLETAEFLAAFIETSQVHLTFLPAIVFLMAGLIAFSTGTSWGSFAILIPIAGQIAGTTDMTLLLPVLAAVLGGAVFGDIYSLIYYTTIYSVTFKL